MRSYRFYFFNPAGHIVDRQDCECRTEQAAIHTARGLLTLSLHRMIEVWEGARRVYSTAEEHSRLVTM